MSARSIGNVGLTMGLVNCPVQIYTAVDSHDRKGSMYHAHLDGTYGKVKMPKTCEDCSEAVAPGGIVTGYDWDGATVILTDDDKAAIEKNSGASIEILRFVRAKQIKALLLTGEKAYYLAPDTDQKRGSKQGVATYLTIRQVLLEEDLVGVVQYTRWRKNRIALLRVEDTEYGGCLVVQNLLWPDELREPEFPVLMKAVDADVDARLLPVARMVIQSMTEDWNADDYQDTYEEQLTAAIEAKAGGKPIEVADVEDAPKADDIEALIAALEKTAAAKQGGAKAPPKKAAPAKAAVKKAGPKRSAA